MFTERILIVEDEPVVALDLQHTLEEMGHEVVSISECFESAIESVIKHSPTLVMMDIHLQGKIDGIEACDAIYHGWKIPVVFLTAYVDEKTVNRAAACRPFGYLMKPYHSKELYATLQVARSRHDSEAALARSEERLALALEAAELGIWEWESQLDKIKGDVRFERICGSMLCPVTTRLGAMLERVHSEDRSKLENHLNKRGFFHISFRALRETGGYAWLELYGNRRERLDETSVIVGAIRDISIKKEIEDKLRQASVVYSTIAEGIMILDSEGKLISVNPAFSQLTGYDLGNILGLTPEEFLIVRQDSDPSYQELAASTDGNWTSEGVCKCNDGRVFNALQQVCVVRDEDGKAIQFVHTISDLTSIRATEKQLVYLAYHDSLTKLPNRRMFMDRLKHAMASGDRSQQYGALLFIDMDDFKTLNDTLGHDMGDMLLEEVARRLSSCVRECDTVARLGGDEFMVMLEQLSQHSEEAAIQTEIVAKKIIAHLDEEYALGVHDYRCTPSVGATLFLGNVQHVDELIKQADIAMYQSKKGGRNQLSFFDPSMQQSVIKRATLDAELHRALERQEFRLHYQIQVDAWRQAIGAEALIRWHHPELGTVSPLEFIPLAEETGLILPIGQWVLKTACQQIQAWQNNPKTCNLVLAVNISAKQIRQKNFSSTILALIEKYQVPPHLLKLEITESVLLEDVEETIQTMLGLNNVGIRFSMDDFGAGYSSLQYLKRLPLEQLKIDRSFVQDLENNASDRTIVRTIITMAQSLGIDVIAEGVETEAQRELLQNKGCIHYQGYLFGKPVDIEQFNRFLD